MTDFLDEKRREISDRLKELKQYVDEYTRLESAASALATVRGSSSSSDSTATVKRRRGPGRPKGARAAAAATATKAKKRAPSRKKAGRPAARPAAKAAGRPAKRRAGRRKGSGTRAAEALSFVQGQPGITIPELAAKMGIKQNYLYRVLPGLESEGKVKKQGRGWLPRG